MPDTASKDRTSKTTSVFDRPVQLAGATVTALGILVLYGWGAGSQLLVQLLERAAPLRVDLAFGFVLSGAALFLLPSRKYRAAQLLAGGAIAVAAFAAVKHLLREPGLPLDYLFASHPSAAFSTYTSRMSVPAALYLGMASLGLIALPRRPRASLALGMLTATLALVGIAGGLVGGLETQQGGPSTAVHASIGFLLLGAGLALAAMQITADSGRRRIEPYLVGMVTAAGTLVFWQSLVHQETLQVQRLINASAVGIRSTLATNLTDLTSALEVLAAETDRLDGDIEAWDSNVQILLANQPSVAALWWLKRDGSSIAVKWSPGSATASLPMAPAPDELAALEVRAQRQSRRVIMGRIAPQTDAADSSLRILLPLHRGAGDELLLAVVDIASFARDALEGIESESAVTMRAGSEVLFRSTGTADKAGRRSVTSATATLPLPGGTNWTIVVGPSATQLGTRSAIPAVALLAGLVISALLISALNGSERERQRAHELAEALRRLELQTRQLRDTERRLLDLNQQLENRVDERTSQLSRANGVLERENRLRRRAQTRLTSANQHLREFDAFISHELRQPLAAMRLWVDLLQTAGSAELADKQRGYAAKVSVEITRMSELIENELALSKASDIDSLLTPVALDEVLDDLAGTLAPRLEEVGGALAVAPLPTVLADARMMRQLFLNLLDNAIKYRRDDVPLRISVRAAEEHRDDFVETYGEEFCEIIVEDNGHGIPADKCAEIFELFRRVGDSPGVSGSGVGLAVCRRIAERHDGAIEADPTARGGARFRVVLPLAEDDLAVAEGAGAAPAS